MNIRIYHLSVPLENPSTSTKLRIKRISLKNSEESRETLSGSCCPLMTIKTHNTSIPPSKILKLKKTLRSSVFTHQGTKKTHGILESSST
jgi:hypothetical protein